MKTIKKKTICAAVITLCIMMFLSVPCYAVTERNYGEYDPVAAVKDCSPTINGVKYNICSMQGLAVGSTYLYTAKIDVKGRYAVIHRTNKDTGKQEILTYTGTNSNYIDCLGHANDMCVTSINNKSNLYIVTCNSDKNKGLVRMQVSGSKISKVAEYTLLVPKKNSNNVTIGFEKIAPTGVTIVNKDSSDINFLFKNGSKIYKGSVGINDTSGTINLTEAFSLKKDKVTIGGVKTDITSFAGQGISYYKNDLYVAWSGHNEGLADGLKDKNNAYSVITVYKNVKNATGAIDHSPTLSFGIKSEKYSAFFEIESCGISPSDGKMYFNTNRRVTSSDTNHDGVHYIKGFVLS